MTRAPAAPHRRRHAAPPGLVAPALLALLACGADPPAAQPAAPKQPEAAPAEKPADKQPEPFATPKLVPPPAPLGAVLLLDPPLYVQSCGKAPACPLLQQPAGETHCRELDLGGFKNWRLPERAEVKRFKGPDFDFNNSSFEWTRTAYADDPTQAWIVTPSSGQETTIPRTRKPFQIRCVLDP